MKLLILQHPQEAKKKQLGSVPILESILGEQCRVRVGLSWSNLAKAWLRKDENKDDPKLRPTPSRWAVLFLGTKSGEKKTEWDLADDAWGQIQGFKKFPNEELEGVVLLDGNWAQSKTMWWRNSWLLRLQRIVLKPAKRSLYGDVRKEPRKEAVSTLEAAAICLAVLGKKPETAQKLIDGFKTKLEEIRSQKLSESQTHASNIANE